MLGAIEDAIEVVKTAHSKYHYSRNIVLLAALNDRNDFNIALLIPNRIMLMIRSYRQDREVIHV